MQPRCLEVGNRIIYALKCDLLRLLCLEVTFNCLFHGNRLDPPHCDHAKRAADANDGAGLPLRRSAMTFAR